VFRLVLPALAAVFAFVTVAACSEDDPPPTPSTPCVPPPRAGASVALAAFGDRVFAQPVELVEGPGRRFYVVEQTGKVKVLPSSGRGGEPTLAIDLTGKISSGGESGLLGIAFDPKFADNGFVYLHFDENIDKKPDTPYQSVIARFTSTDGGTTFDKATEKVVIKVDHPFTNHNGGRISFGPDGMLYWGLGDGGSGGDPRGNGQNKDALLGKILRLDPSSADPYGIPPTNPFVNGGGRPEIFAHGFRNPWKHSFDKLTGELWVADVGQSKFEEINRVVVGGNYGWNIREGKHCFNAEHCATAGLTDPIAEYTRNDGISISGGYVYRGTKIPDLVGKFVYGDFGSGNIWSVETFGQPTSTLLTASNLRISTFGQDSDGELYVADYASGMIKTLIAGPPPPATDATSSSLVATGCIDPADATQAPSGAIPYDVSSPLWSDGAQKSRWLFVPSGSKITVGADGDFDVPPASVAVKTFKVGDKKVETRLFVRYADGGWAGYSYEWNDAQTDAVLLAEGKTKDLGNGSSWYFPSRNECFACHTPMAGFTLGLEARQLGPVLDRFAPVLDKPLAKEAFAPLRAADTVGATNEERARGYLHANCSMCHREGSGAGAATLDLRVDRAFAAMRTCNVAPQAGELGVPDAKLVTPGDPAKSTLVLRMRATDANRMPSVASRVVDETGARAVESWIRELTSCP
jgi:uncharacterized repeat protein (TIGR03806 family)